MNLIDLRKIWNEDTIGKTDSERIVEFADRKDNVRTKSFAFSIKQNFIDTLKWYYAKELVHE